MVIFPFPGIVPENDQPGADWDEDEDDNGPLKCGIGPGYSFCCKRDFIAGLHEKKNDDNGPGEDPEYSKCLF